MPRVHIEYIHVCTSTLLLWAYHYAEIVQGHVARYNHESMILPASDIGICILYLY